MIYYPYLYDDEFLKDFDKESFKEQFIRITVLDFCTEEEKASIEGLSTAGTCNFSGTSNMRRTASCTIIVDTNENSYGNITDIQNIISMNKKVKIATGFKNTLKYKYANYANYDIIWFPMGTYVIKTASVSKNNSSINISLTLNDKCALLNGDMGGTLPAAAILSEIEVLNPVNKTVETEPILIKDLIRSLVMKFGGERAENIIIADIPDVIPKIVRWSGQRELYRNTALSKAELILEPPADKETYIYGQDVGKILEPFVYPGRLECNAGETVASILDKIKNILGNFEWFYDIDGRFVFQEIKNYLNTSQAMTLLTLTERDYLSIGNYSKSVYSFDNTNSHLINSVSNSPQYQNIKNDFIVWGAKKSGSGANVPIRYHLAFDDKPTFSSSGEKWLCLIYEDTYGIQRTIPLINTDTETNYEDVTDLGEMTDKTKYYFYNNYIYCWNESVQNFATLPQAEVCYIKLGTFGSDTTNPQYQCDWRTKLYLEGLKDKESLLQNYYFAELNAEFPKICEMKGTEIEGGTFKTYIPKFRHELLSTDSRYVPMSEYTYWLDFLSGDTIGGISQFNVHNIGRRTKVDTKNSSNCLFPFDVPNVYFAEANGKVLDARNKVQQYGNGGQLIQVSPEIYRYLIAGGESYSAFEKIQELLITHTQYNESISLSTIPVYHLEPNTRITVFDNETGVHGDYLIKTISLPLTTNGTSNISATKCIEKTI